MLNRNLLKAAIVRSGYTQEALAKDIGISNNTLSSRMTGASCFNVDEIDKICNILNIRSNEEKCDIFLCSPSQIWESANKGKEVNKSE